MTATERISLTAPIADTVIAVDRTGDRSRPPIVWLHSEFGPLDGVPGRDRLADAAHVVELHLPGWGVSTGGDDFDRIDELATLMWWAVESLELDRPVLAGHGLGATLAVEMAIQQPPATRSLVLAAPFGVFRAEDPGVDMFALLPRDLNAHLYADPAGPLVQRHFPAPGDAHERGLAAIRRVEVLGSASRYLFPIPDTNVAPRAYRLAGVPMSIWFGATDGVVPPSLASDWRACCDHADINVVDDAAHMVAYEHGGFAQALVEALDEERSPV